MRQLYQPSPNPVLEFRHGVLEGLRQSQPRPALFRFVAEYTNQTYGCSERNLNDHVCSSNA
jgi:hypothetical protein